MSNKADSRFWRADHAGGSTEIGVTDEEWIILQEKWRQQEKDNSVVIELNVKLGEALSYKERYDIVVRIYDIRKELNEGWVSQFRKVRKK